MRKTRILLTGLIMIALLLLMTLIILLFHPSGRNEDAETAVSPVPGTAVPSPQPPLTEEVAPVSQEYSSGSAPTGTDIYMEFPVITE